MSQEEDTVFWEDFIDIYRENPCLWNNKCADYTDESKKNIAYGLLLEKLWEIDDNADIDTVKKKITSFRETFSENIRKIKRWKQKGKDYIPKWNYYKHFNFLIPFEDEKVKESVSETSINSVTTETIIDTTQYKLNMQPIVPQLNYKRDNILEEVLTKSQTSKTKLTEGLNDLPPGKKRKCSKDGEDDFLEDDCSTFAAYVKTKMRSFDPMQKCIAQKLISEVIFLAETKKLQLTSGISNLPDK